ncbi:hypothetical protein [Achromobacter deleyi]|uniref:hypothetical protein n=1 Tax=Achromobacter deleyi TaxID=1353891 RepID=UPI0014910421|nr:hypothetical protein [Achromobacter deleyi]QVQ26988.1 hypothetical protein HLG70_00545 [Achromobacter deleyi]UIP22567.1 hypothetical protein LYZ39_08645 [Achromobacter deleyi]
MLGERELVEGRAATREACIAALTSASFRRILGSVYSKNYCSASPTEFPIDIDLVNRVAAHVEIIISHNLRRALYLTIYIAAAFYAAALVLAIIVGQANEFLEAALKWLGLFLTIAATICFPYCARNLDRKIRDELLPIFWNESVDIVSTKHAFTDRLTPVGTKFESPSFPVSIHTSQRIFVGFGTEVGDWKLLVDVTRPAAGDLHESCHKFHLDDLYDHLARELGGLMQGSNCTSMNYFVDGRKVTDVPELSPHIRGVSPRSISSNLAKKWREAEADCLGRCYLTSRLAIDGMVMTVAVRISMTGPYLAIEAHRLLLPPIKSEWRRSEASGREPASGSIDALATLFSAGAYGLDDSDVDAYLWTYRRLNLLGPMPFGSDADASHRLRNFRHWNAWRSSIDRLKKNGKPDFGCAGSFRELVAGENFENRDQVETSTLCFRMLDRVLLDALRKFLEDHCVSTRDFEEDRQSIVNSGIFVQYGNFEASSVAMGAGATAESFSSTPSVQSKVPRVRRPK